MSEQWIFFPCQMGEHCASIFYDHGLRDHIDILTPPKLLKARIAFKDPRPDGMPGSDEFQHLMALEDGLQNLVNRQESVYVGRVTVDGHRHFYIYTAGSEETWAAHIEDLGKSHGYSIAFDLSLDERRKGYREELFPTDDDWQVIQDLRVLEALKKEGDDGTSSRQIDHWAYFTSLECAQQFSRWIVANAYSTVPCQKNDDDKVCVRFRHEGTLRLSDITSHTVALRRKANEFGGEYDGWETPICNA